MTTLIELRDAFSQFWHSKAEIWSKQKHQSFHNSDRFEAFCAAKDNLQDTCEAIQYHMARGFSDVPSLAYIEFWGVMQALTIQRDAIRELHYAVRGHRLAGPNLPDSWLQLSEIRNQSVGHPNRKEIGEAKGVVVRCVTGREPKSYEMLILHYHSGKDPRHKNISLKDMITSFEIDAVSILKPLFTEIEEQLG